MSTPPLPVRSDPLPPGGQPSWWRAVRKRILWYGTAYLLFILAVMFAGCADKLLLFPSTNPIPISAARRTIPFHKGVLEIWTDRSPGLHTQPPQLYVLHFNGNGSRAETELDCFLPLWRGRDVEMWAVNYPGFGKSTPPARLDLIPQAALAAYDALAKEAQGRPIVVSGFSIGTTAALYIATRRPVAGLFLQSPPPLQNLILHHHGWWNLWLLAWPVSLGVPESLNSLVTAPKVRVPAVFALSEKDSVVPLEYQDQVVSAYAGLRQIVLLRGADHNSPITDQDANQISQSLAWLLEQIAKKP